MMHPAASNNQLSSFSFAVQLDDISLDTLRSLSSLCHHFRRSTSTVQRIQGGSPGAGQLGQVIRKNQSNFTTIAAQCQQIFTRHSQLPGMNLLRARFNQLQQTLGASFDDSSQGYAERVHILEKLNYENGTLKSVVETIIEHHEYQKNKLAGQAGNQQPVAQRLTFSDAPNSQSAAPFGDQHRHSLSQLQVSQNQPAASYYAPTSNQPFQLGQDSFPQLPAPALGGNSFATPLIQTQQLGSTEPLPTTGIQASVSRPSPLGSSQLGLGLQPSTTSGNVATHPQPPMPRRHVQDSPGLGSQQFGSGPSSTVVQPPVLRSGPLNLRPLPSTTSSTTVTQAQHPPIFGLATLPSTPTMGQLSTTGPGGQSTAVTMAQAQTFGGPFGSRPLAERHVQSGTEISTKNGALHVQAPTLTQTGDGFSLTSGAPSTTVPLGGHRAGLGGGGLFQQNNW